MKYLVKTLVILACVIGLMFSAKVQAYNPLCPTKDANGMCTSGACEGNGEDSPTCQQAKAQGTKNPIAGPGGIINTAANLIALVTGVGAVIMIIIGGAFYVTSAGNTDTVNKAKSRITAGLIGLVVVALAWTIVTYVSNNVIQ